MQARARPIDVIPRKRREKIPNIYEHTLIGKKDTSEDRNLRKKWNGEIRHERNGSSLAQALSQHQANASAKECECKPADDLVSL